MSATHGAAYFDGWYAAKDPQGVADRLQREHLGLPEWLLTTSGLTWDGIADVSARLALPPGGVLLDLGCGRGGYGIELASRAGATLVGVDFSAVAVQQATDLAAARGADARFVVGDLTATGLPAHCVDGAVCIDAVQFAEPPAAAYAELRRVLRPGGRAVLTCWRPVDPADARLPARLRTVDLPGGLRGAGFRDVVEEERPGWRVAERAMWDAALAMPPADDPALASLQAEGARTLARWDAVRRVLARGMAP